MRFALALCLAAAVSFTDAMTFAVIGDWGTGGRKYAAQSEMRSTMQLVEVCKQIGCNFTLSCGDNIYTPNVVEGITSSFTTDMREMKGPLFASVGNHDHWGAQVAYSKVNKRWRFMNRFFNVKVPLDDTGYTIEIFSVDTTDGSLGGGGQYQWLESKLKASDARWKFIFGHYPTTGSGRHGRMGSVSRLHGLMDKYNAQAYFAGHDHIVDLSNIAGRTLPISGGMARGGMMWRGLGSTFRRFSLTHPSENNKYVQDWPGFGFFTADISPNVMTLSIWDFAGGVAYTFATTWDWLSKVHSRPVKERNMWPPPEEIHKALKDEITLPPGPGGGTWFDAAGNDGSSAVNSAATPAPVTLAPNATPAPTTAAPKATDLPKMAEATAHPQQEEHELIVRYGVSTECVPCHHHPTARIPFTVFLDGETIPAGTKLYLTPSVTGCDVITDPPLVAGTSIVELQGNLHSFTSTGAGGTKAHACIKGPGMKNYFLMERSDSVLAPNTFVIHEALNMTLPDGSTLDLNEIPKGHEHEHEHEGGPNDGEHDFVATPAPLDTTGDAMPNTVWSLVAVAALCVGVAVIAVRFTNPAAVARWLDGGHTGIETDDDDDADPDNAHNKPHRATAE